ncbi:hypothetical protein AMJ48_02905 [Parcubacteria bacterium DG_74_1]|nr:MAG: hypothetical protein AMJ48_02905 [Parcubacteria bacterium DG_74_1]
MKKKILILIAVILFLGTTIFVLIYSTKDKAWTTTRGQTDLIKLFSPQDGDIIESPLVVTGKARGSWFFEADFPVLLTNWDGLIIAEALARAQEDWMTTDYVPFEAVLVFESPVFADADEKDFSRQGYLILQKDNPSGLPEHDDALEVSVRFK